MTRKVVYLMRGLPSCGKSHMAKRLAADGGVVCEADAYFLSEVGNDPHSYDYDAALLEEAQRWNFERFVAAIEASISPIVVDRGAGLSQETRRYARYAVELKEPDSPWWQEIRVLLKYKEYTKPVLIEWSERLAEMSRSKHRVSAEFIRHLMSRWHYGLTVEEILGYEPPPAAPESDGDRTDETHELSPSGNGGTPGTGNESG